MNIHEISKKYRFLIFIVFSVFFFAMIFKGSGLQPSYDETMFIEAATSWKETGLPIHNANEVVGGHHHTMKYLPEDVDDLFTTIINGKEVKLFLFHPPLYLKLLSESIAFFGENGVGYRVVQITFAYLTAILIYLITLHLFKDKKNKYSAALLSSGIYLINPFVIKSALLVDINGGILSFFVTLFLLVYLKMTPIDTPKKTFYMLILLFIVFFTKIEGGAILSIAIILYLVVKKASKKEMKLNMSAILISILMLYLTLWTFTTISGINYLYAFQHVIFKILVRQRVFFDILKSAMTLLWTIKNYFFWVIPPIFIIATIIWFKRSKRFFKKECEKIDLLTVYSLTVILGYWIITWSAIGFPKYIIGAMPALCILISGYIMDLKMKEFVNKKNYVLIVIAIIMIMLFNIFVLKDPFIEHTNYLNKTIVFEENIGMLMMSNLKGLLFLAPILIAMLVILHFGIKRAFIISCVLNIFVLSIYVSYIQADADYLTIYGYGQRGLPETIEYLKQNSDEQDIIASRYDIAFHSGRMFYKMYPYIVPWDSEPFEKAIERNEIRYIILGPGEIEPSTDKFIKKEEIWNFVIYERIGDENEKT